MANIPSPVVGAGGGGRQPLSEALLLTLASAAPGLLTQYLGQRQQSQDAAAQGEASTQIMVELARQGVISPDLFTSVGGQVTPGRTVQGGTTPSGLETPTITTQTRAGAGSIDRRVAPQLLSQLMSTQQAQAGIEASRASTEASRAQTTLTLEQGRRETDLHPLRMSQIKEGILSERFNRQAESRRLKLMEQAETRAAGNEAERIGIERERLGLQRREAVQNVTTRLSSLYSDQFERFTRMAQLYASAGLAPDAARARASADVWNKLTPLSEDEFLQANTEKAVASILTDQAGDPDAAIFRSVTGERPDLAYGSKIGLPPERVQFINTRLEVAEGDAQKVLAEAAKTLPEGPDREAALAEILLYLSYKTDMKVTPPAAESKGIRAQIQRILQATEQGGIGKNIADAIGLGKGVMERQTNVTPTPTQQQQMDSGFFRGWAPPAK